MARYINHYQCDHADSLEEGEPLAEWDDEWSCMCDDRCPVCNHATAPYESEELGDA